MPSPATNTPISAHPAPPRLQTERLILRCPEPMRDAPEAFAAVVKDRRHLQRWLPWPALIQTEDHERKFLEDVVGYWQENTQFHWLIFDRASFVYMGIVGTARLDWRHGVAELGYWLTRDFEGEGRMSEAVRCVERTLFAMGFHRLEIRCSGDNERSSNIAKRLNYQLDGRLRQDRVEQGIRVDTLIWSKLRDDLRDESTTPK